MLKNSKTNLKDLKTQSCFKQILSLFCILIRTIGYPLDLLIASQGVFERDKEMSFAISIMYLCLNITNLVSLILILCFVIKLFKFCLPHDVIIWSQPNSKFEILNFLCKILLVLLLNFDFNYSLGKIFLIITFVLCLINFYF